MRHGDKVSQGKQRGALWRTPPVQRGVAAKCGLHQLQTVSTEPFEEGDDVTLCA